MRWIQSSLAAFSILLALACSRAALQTASPQPQPEALALTQRCTNALAGFTVSYPRGWQTNDGSVIPACSAFHPESFEIPRESELPFEIAVTIGREDAPFTAEIASNQFETVLSSERVQVAGRDAVRVEVEATGEGLADRGMRSVRYLVDLEGGRTLVATTHDAGGDYQRKRQILDRMAATLILR